MSAITERGAVPLGEFTRDCSSAVEDIEIRPRALTCRIGSNEIDRYLTVVRPSGIDYASFNRSGGPCLWQHGAESRGSLPVGRAQVKYRPPPDDDLIARVVFRDDEFSRELFKCYADSTLSGWSLRALPRSQQCGPPSYEEIRARPELERCSTVFRSAELVELSAVAIPGCRSAVTLMIERSLWSPVQARQYLATHHVPVKPPSAPARSSGPEGGLRLEWRPDTAQWIVYSGGSTVVNAYMDDPGALQKAGRLLRSLSLTGMISRSLGAGYPRPCLEFDAPNDRWLVRGAGGGIIGGFDAGLDDALSRAAKRLRSAGGGAP
jgi:hypothetical protein